MKNSVIIMIMAVVIAIQPSAQADPSISGAISYQYTKQSGQERDLTPNVTIYLGQNLGKYVSFHGSFATGRVNTEPTYHVVNDAYFELTNQKMSCMIGKQSYTLGDGFLASFSAINGIRTVFQNDNETMTAFFSKYERGILAANYSSNQLLKNRNLIMDASYFKMETGFGGLKLATQLNQKAAVSVTITRNWHTQAAGYLFFAQYGQAQQRGDADIWLSYRNVQSGAVSAYSADTNFDNSKGIRLGTDYKIANNLNLAAFRDFVKTRDNTDKNETNIVLYSFF